MTRINCKYEIAYLNPSGVLIHVDDYNDNALVNFQELGYYFILNKVSRRVTTYHYNGHELRRVRQPKFMAAKIQEWKESVFN